MKPKINWRKKYEETAGLLKLARDGNAIIIRDRDDYQTKWLATVDKLKNRPTVEKIVEKEVLPVFVMPMFCALALLFVVLSWLASHQIHQLQEPILSPYPVYIAKYVPPDPYALDVCHDAWKADERELRKLRKELK